MVVAIEQHQVTAGQQRIGDHLICSGGAVQHKVGFISIKDFCRELLGMLGGAFVDQQIAQFHIGIAHIGAKYVLTEEFIELPSRRVFFKKCTVLVSRTGKSTVAHRHVLAQGVKKWRQQILFIPAGRRLQFQKLLSFT